MKTREEMDSLIIKGDETTPSVNLNAKTGHLSICGVAIPEDVRELSKPIIKWIEDYSANPKLATELVLDFEYLNTAATKMVFQVCENVGSIHNINNCKVKLVWKYVRGDIEMLELGEEVLDSFDCITELIAVDKLF